MSSRKLYGPKKIPQMGTLTVEVKTVDKTWFAVFHKGGDQGDKWHQGHVDLSVSPQRTPSPKNPYSHGTFVFQFFSLTAI